MPTAGRTQLASDRFSRDSPTVAKRVTFGQRKFVREMDAKVRRDASGQLIAFDGFENLAGKIRRGRSGFGFKGGWFPPGRRKKSGTIINAPPDQVFGIERDGQRLLEIGGGTTLCRDLEAPLLGDVDSETFFSFVLHRKSDPEVVKDAFFQFHISQAGRVGRRGNREKIGFGVTSKSFPFVKNRNQISNTAVKLPNEILLCVANVSVDDQNRCQVKLRVYQADEEVDEDVPDFWTVTSSYQPVADDLSRVVLSTGTNSSWHVDHLRIGRTWSSVVSGAAFKAEPAQ